MSNVDKRHYFAIFAFCVALGHIAGNGILLIYDEYLSIAGVLKVNRPGEAWAVLHKASSLIN